MCGLRISAFNFLFWNAAISLSPSALPPLRSPPFHCRSVPLNSTYFFSALSRWHLPAPEPNRGCFNRSYPDLSGGKEDRLNRGLPSPCIRPYATICDHIRPSRLTPPRNQAGCPPPTTPEGGTFCALCVVPWSCSPWSCSPWSPLAAISAFQRFSISAFPGAKRSQERLPHPPIVQKWDKR